MRTRTVLRACTIATAIAGTVFAGAALVVSTIGEPSGAAFADTPTSVSIADPTGDVVNHDTGAPLTDPAADIVAATVTSAGNGLTVSVRFAGPTDPTTDPDWASPDSSVTWALYTTPDGRVADLVNWGAGEQPGTLAAQVVHYVPGQPATTCDAPATHDPTAGETVVVDPTCLGNPGSLFFRVSVNLDTQPGVAKGVQAYDAAPDRALAGPVTVVPLAAPPTAAPSPSPSATPGPPNGAAVSGTGRPSSASHPKSSAARPPNHGRTTPAGASAPSGGASAPTSSSPNAAAPAPLARTGVGARRTGAVGLGLLLVGLGMTAATRRRSPVSPGP